MKKSQLKFENKINSKLFQRHYNYIERFLKYYTFIKKKTKKKLIIYLKNVYMCMLQLVVAVR